MKHLKPAEAARFLDENPAAVFIDCRSEMEYYFVGQVKKVASMNRPVVLICRSGHRSLDAGIALEKAGFSDVYNVQDGFEGPIDDDHHRGTISGWRKDGLPWEQL